MSHRRRGLQTRVSDEDASMFGATGDASDRRPPRKPTGKSKEGGKVGRKGGREGERKNNKAIQKRKRERGGGERERERERLTKAGRRQGRK